MKSKDNTVRIHSDVADRASATKLWYYCRFCSDNGLANINLKEVSNYFNVTVQTVRNWLTWCVKNKFIRAYSTDNKGNYSIFYSALTKVCGDSFGAVANINLKEHKNLKVTATEALAQYLQNIAKFAAKKNFKDFKIHNPYQRKVRPINKLFDSTPSELKALGVLGETKRYLLVDHNFTTYGVSYDRISNFLNRSISTVKRRLKNTIKKQLAQHKNEYYAEYYFALEDFNSNKFIYSKVNKDNLIFKALMNVYYSSLELTSMRYRRNELKNTLRNS